jgi:adenosine kinase
MTSTVFISGSIAYDTIMVFAGHFKDHILADQTHNINVSFFAPSMRKEYGGCAANIAYTLNGLGGKAVPLAGIGKDGTEYLAHMKKTGVDTSLVYSSADEYTAQAFITTDLSNNQITAFHPGAMSQAHLSKFTHHAAANTSGKSLGIVAPNGKDAMFEHAAAFKAAGIPFIFDPGQAMPLFSGDDFKNFIAQAWAITVNDYECALLCERTGWSETQIAAMVSAMIVTRGAEGATVYENGQTTHIPVVKISQAVDPTGCGDAFRGGLLYGLSNGWSWADSARLASVMGGIKIEQQGGQNHVATQAGVAARLQEAFGLKFKD